MYKTDTKILHKDEIKLTNKVFIPFLKEKKIPEENKEDEIEKDNLAYELEESVNKIKNEIDILNQQKIKLEDELSNIQQEKKIYAEEHKKEIEKTKQEAEEIIKDSQNKAKEIISEVNQRKEEIEKETNQNKENIINEYKDIGYKEGYKKGDEQREEVETFLKKILNEAIKTKNGIIESIRGHLVEIVFVAVKKIVKQITESDKKVVLDNIVHALNKIDDPIKLTIKVSYDDLKTSKDFKQQILESFKNLEQVEVVGDSSIERGGCVVETDFNIVDARISSQLEKIDLVLNSLDLLKSTKQ